jgi:hypothetical protein
MSRALLQQGIEHHRTPKQYLTAASEASRFGFFCGVAALYLPLSCRSC